VGPLAVAASSRVARAIDRWRRLGVMVGGRGGGIRDDGAACQPRSPVDADPVFLKQPALGAEPAAAMSLQWRQRGDPVALWRALQALHQPGAVIGIGAPLAAAVGADLPGLRPFERLQRGRFALPATRLDVWASCPRTMPARPSTRPMR